MYQIVLGRHLFITLLFIFLGRTSAWIHVDCPKSLRLGVSLYYIRDSQMTSSSHLSSNYQSKYGRLDGNRAWCPGPSKPNGQIPQSKAWLQVNLIVSHIICAVAIQGSRTEDRWVTMYRLSYSTDEKNWMNERRFSTGNRNRNKPKYSHPFEPRIAKYVRFNVVNKRHRNWPCMRVELFGQKVWDFKKNFITYDRSHKIYTLVSPTGVEYTDGRGHIKSIRVKLITKLPNPGSRQAQVTHSLANNMAVYPDIRPRVSSLYSGSDVLIVLPKARYLPGKIVAALGNNLYEVRRSDNGKTEIMRRDYLRQKGLDPCELDNACPQETNCKNDELHRTAGYYCVCNQGYVEIFKGWPRLMEGKCKDVNECQDKVSNCPQHSNCVNTPGSFECNCKSGYIKTANNKCIDVDECSVSPSPCSSGFTCHNSPGSYKCEDVNECLKAPCWEGENCVNTHGSFRCDIPERTEEPKLLPMTTIPTETAENQDLSTSPNPTVEAQAINTRRPNKASSSSAWSCWIVTAVLVFAATVLLQF